MNKDFEDWLVDEAPEVLCTLEVTVGNQIVYKGEFYSVDAMEHDLRKPEQAIMQALREAYEEQYDWDGLAKDQTLD